MKKTVYAIMLLLGISMFMVSCSEGTADRQSDDNQTAGSDDPDGGTDNEDNPLIGTWDVVREYLMLSGEMVTEYRPAEGEEYCVFDESKMSLCFTGESPETYQYTFDGKIISFTDGEGYPTEYEVVSITDTDMTIHSDAGDEDGWYHEMKKR